jgi:hypothetical protein
MTTAIKVRNVTIPIHQSGDGVFGSVGTTTFSELAAHSRSLDSAASGPKKFAWLKAPQNAKTRSVGKTSIGTIAR